MFTVDDIRGLLRLSVEECSDDELERYINLFTLQIAAKIGKDPNDEELLNSPLFDEALLRLRVISFNLTPRFSQGLPLIKSVIRARNLMILTILKKEESQVGAVDTIML